MKNVEKRNNKIGGAGGVVGSKFLDWVGRWYGDGDAPPVELQEYY